MGDGVSVDLGALTTFAHAAGRLADEAQPDTKGLVGDITNQARDALTGSMHSMAVTANELDGTAGHANFTESSAFARYHIVVALSAAQFLNDVFLGTASLGAGAEYCAVNYANTDSFNAQTLGNIRTSLKEGGLAGQDFIMSGNANISGSNVNDAFAPKQGDGLWAASGTAPAPVDPNKVNPKDTKDPDPSGDFQKATDQQRQDIASGKVPDLPGHSQAPDGTTMPFPDDTPKSGQTGSGGVSV